MHDHSQQILWVMIAHCKVPCKATHESLVSVTEFFFSPHPLSHLAEKVSKISAKSPIWLHFAAQSLESGLGRKANVITCAGLARSAKFFDILPYKIFFHRFGDKILQNLFRHLAEGVSKISANAQKFLPKTPIWRKKNMRQIALLVPFPTKSRSANSDLTSVARSEKPQFREKVI